MCATTNDTTAGQDMPENVIKFPRRKDMKTMYYFAYGSNLNADDLQEWCDKEGNALILDAATARVAYLLDHRPAFTRRSKRRKGGVLDVIPAPGHVAPGVVFRVNAERLAVLDHKEGVAVNCYRRMLCCVQTADGNMIEAITYAVADPDGRHIPPSPEYAEVVRKGYARWDLPRRLLDDAIRGKSRPLPVFVYGTLKRGFSRHNALLEHGASFVGAAHLNARMVDTGCGYPAVALPDSSAPVTDVKRRRGDICHGELYVSTQASLWKALDDIEGYDPTVDGTNSCLYWRRALPVRVDAKGRGVRPIKPAPHDLAWVYCQSTRAATQGTPLPDGKWPFTGNMDAFCRDWLDGLAHDLATSGWKTRLPYAPKAWYACDVTVTSQPTDITPLDEWYGKDKLCVCRPDAACIAWMFYALRIPLRERLDYGKSRWALAMLGDMCVASATLPLEELLERMIVEARKHLEV